MIKTILAVWIAGILTTAAHANGVYKAEGAHLHNPNQVNIYGAKLSYIPPAWDKDTDDSVKRSGFYKLNKKHMFKLEEVPKGESFTQWKESFTITGYGGLTGSAEDDVKLWTQKYVKGCGQQYMSVSSFSLTKKHVFLMIVCEKTPYAEEAGYGNQVGTVALVAYKRLGPVGVFSKHEWRGKAFERNDMESWPVSQDDFDQALERMKYMSFVQPS